MKTSLLFLGFLLLAQTGFGMGHPHNLFAARQRLVTRLQIARQLPPGSVLPLLPVKAAESAACRLPFRLVLPGRNL